MRVYIIETRPDTWSRILSMLTSGNMKSPDGLKYHRGKVIGGYWNTHAHYPFPIHSAKKYLRFYAPKVFVAYDFTDRRSVEKPAAKPGCA